MRDVKREILNFWFGEVKPEQWFQKDSVFDDTIKNRFENDYMLAAKGVYDSWQSSPESILSLVILLDQFPRNMYRNNPLSFATDTKALRCAQLAVRKDMDENLSPAQKQFLYMPFQHSEDIKIQIQSVDLYRSLSDSIPEAFEYAKAHKDVIEQFGRFPHRNIILGRKNTDAEDVYLENNPSPF